MLAEEAQPVREFRHLRPQANYQRSKPDVPEKDQNSQVYLAGRVYAYLH